MVHFEHWLFDKLWGAERDVLGLIDLKVSLSQQSDHH